MLTFQNPVKSLTPDASPQSVMMANFVAPILDQSEPHIRAVSLEHIDTLDALMPFASTNSSFRSEDVHMVEASNEDASFLAKWLAHSKNGVVFIRAATVEQADKAEAAVVSCRPPIPTTEESARLDFWQVDGSGDPYTNSRAIDAPEFSTITDNYPLEVLEHLERLRTIQPTVDDGRILLWHGPPGTGKTSAIRALARAWGERIRVQVLLDPERILAGSAMLMSVLLDGSADHWRLLVIEDADELLRADAKDRVGQALSRLLNLSDGLLGQGTKVLVLITTNEPIGRIHPALVRPGRCLLETEFRRFSRTEAERVSERSLPAGSTFSLAELSAIAAGKATTVSQDQAYGTYL